MIEIGTGIFFYNFFFPAMAIPSPDDTKYNVTSKHEAYSTKLDENKKNLKE